MFNFNQSRSFLAVVGCALAGFLFAGSANAANPEPVLAEVEWVAPVTITETNALQFGLLDVKMMNTPTVVINQASEGIYGDFREYDLTPRLFSHLLDMP